MAQQLDAMTIEAAERLKARVQGLLGHSLHIRHVDAGSCNGCESEIKLLNNPYDDIQRLGVFFTPSPRHADLPLVTGVVTRAMENPPRQAYEAMPGPCLVVAVGARACSGGVFGSSAYARGGVEGLLPVEVYIPACPPSPLTLIHGLLLAVGRAEQCVQGRTVYLGSTLPLRSLAQGFEEKEEEY